MNTQAQAVLLLLLGGSVVRATLTDMHLRYVKPGLGPFLLAAGATLVVVGVMTLIYDLRSRTAAHDRAADGDAGGHDHGDAGGHDHGGGGGHHEPRVGWLLLLPVLGLLLFAPPALGSDAAGRSGTALSSKKVSDFSPLPQGDGPVRISVLDYASRAVFDLGASLGDREVELTGFVTRDDRDGALYLARIILSCCAADGRPIKVGMTGASAPVDLADDTWIAVRGTYVAKTAEDPVNGDPIPYLNVTGFQRIDPPRQEYE